MDRRTFLKLSALITGALAGSRLLKLSSPRHVTFSHTLAKGSTTILMLGGKGIMGTPCFDGRPMTRIQESPPDYDCWYMQLDLGGYTGSLSGVLRAGESGMVAASAGYSWGKGKHKGAVIFEGSETSSYLRDT